MTVNESVNLFMSSRSGKILPGEDDTLFQSGFHTLLRVSRAQHLNRLTQGEELHVPGHAGVSKLGYIDNK